MFDIIVSKCGQAGAAAPAQPNQPSSTKVELAMMTKRLRDELMIGTFLPKIMMVVMNSMDSGWKQH